MNNKVHKLSIIGATGRMGQMLVHAAQEKKDFQLVGLLEEKGHDLIGTNANELFPSLAKNLVISDSLDKILKVSDVVIDFTNPENSVKVAEEAAKYETLGARILEEGLVVASPGPLYAPRQPAFL